MKEYTVIYNEVVTHEFNIEAESEDEAEKEFYRLCEAGELDFSYGEVTDSSIDVIGG